MGSKGRKVEEREDKSTRAKELETAYEIHALAQLLASRLSVPAVPAWTAWLR